MPNLSYECDVDGQLTAILDQIDPAKSKFISYDDLNRLVQVDEGTPPLAGGTPLPVEDYAYDIVRSSGMSEQPELRVPSDGASLEELVLFGREGFLTQPQNRDELIKRRELLLNSKYKDEIVIRDR